MIDDRMIDDTVIDMMSLVMEPDFPVYKSGLVKNARDLEVYKRAYILSLELHKASLRFPSIEQYGLGDQLRRSSKSVCANIAEGFIKQKYSAAEFKRFLGIAETSAEETRTWLSYAFDLGYIDKQQYEGWDDSCTAVIAMLNNLRARV